MIKVTCVTCAEKLRINNVRANVQKSFANYRDLQVGVVFDFDINRSNGIKPRSKIEIPHKLHTLFGTVNHNATLQRNICKTQLNFSWSDIFEKTILLLTNYILTIDFNSNFAIIVTKESTLLKETNRNNIGFRLT